MAVRARQIRELRIQISDGNMHPRVWSMLEALAEEQHSLQKSLAECIGMMQMIVNQAEAFNMIAEGMKKKLETAERNQQDPNPDMGPVTQ